MTVLKFGVVTQLHMQLCCLGIPSTMVDFEALWGVVSFSRFFRSKRRQGEGTCTHSKKVLVVSAPILTYLQFWTVWLLCKFKLSDQVGPLVIWQLWVMGAGWLRQGGVLVCSLPRNCQLLVVCLVYS